MKEVNINDLKIPIELGICAIPGFNETAFERMGYELGVWFGRSRFKSSIVGWAGHTTNFDVWDSSKEVFNNQHGEEPQDSRQKPSC